MYSLQVHVEEIEKEILTVCAHNVFVYVNECLCTYVCLIKGLYL